MGLKLSLTKNNNPMYYDFPDAYWEIDGLSYTPEQIDFRLLAYPNKEARTNNHNVLEDLTIPYGAPLGGSVNSALYQWHVTMSITNIFPDGVIPAGRAAQYEAIYNWIKEYTELPFEDCN